jgi:dTDP-4-dehydrorhamnose 3,5-epimerase-like enzyme
MYSKLVGPIVCMPMPFEDERGIIQTLVDGDIQAIQIITSVKGSVRANHYHKTDSHYMYVLSGKMKYFHRNADESVDPTWLIISSGQMVYSPPMIEHAVEFLEDSVFLNITSRSRSQENYENDLVRVNLHKPFSKGS